MSDNPQPDAQPNPPVPGEPVQPAYPAQPFDPAAYPPPSVDPNAYPAPPAYPGAAPVDPNAYPAAAPVDPNAYPGAQPYDPNAYPAQPAYPGAAPVDPNAQPYDPNAYPAAAPADPNAYPAYPGAAPVDPNAQPYDPNAYPAQPAYPAAAPADPNAYPAYPGAAPADPNAYPAQGFDPNAYPTQPVDPNAAYAGYAGAPVAAAPKKPMSKGLLFGLIGGGAAVVLIIAAAVVIPILTRAPQVTASDFVEDYLTALSEGDAETALTFVNPSSGSDLLTDDVLKASIELNPIGDIVVKEESTENDYGYEVVEASFTIGDTTVDRTFEVYEAYGDEGDLEIVDGLVSFSSPYGFEGLGLTVNGAEVPVDYTDVFPGTYQFAVGIDAFAIDGETTFVLSDDDSSEAIYDVRSTLSEAGTAKFRELVAASFNECLAMKTLDTPCGMNTSTMSQDGYTPIDGTITRTIDAEAQAKLDNLQPQVSEQAIVTTYDYWSAKITLDGTNGSSTGQFEVLFGAQILSPKVDFSAETPTVIWE